MQSLKLRMKGDSLAIIAPMCIVGLVTQSEGKVRNVTSPSHKVESEEVLDSGENTHLANTGAIEIEVNFNCLLTVRLVVIEKTWLTKTVTTDGTKSAILMQFCAT